MRPKLVLGSLYSLVLIPVVALLVAAGLRAYQSAALRDALRVATPAPSAEAIEQVNIDAFCATAEAQSANVDACYHAAVLAGISHGAWYVIVTAALVLALILLFLRFVRGRPRAIVRTLPLMKVIVALAVVGIAIGNALLILFTMFALSASFIPFPPLKLLIVIGTVGGVLRALRPLPKLRLLFTSPKTEFEGVVLDGQRAPRLYALIARAAAKVGAPPPSAVVAVAHPGISVGLGNASVEGTRVRDRTLYMSLPTCRSLSERELEALLVAEFRSLSPTGTTATVFESLARLRHGFESLMEANVLTKNLLVLPPAVGVFGLLFTGLMSDLEPMLSNEVFAADAGAAHLYTPGTLGAALLKAHLHVLAWMLIVQRSMEGDGASLWSDNVSTALGKVVSAEAKLLMSAEKRERDTELIESLDLSRATYSTPKLGVRLSKIGTSLARIVTAGGKPVARSAASLIPRAEEIEHELTGRVDQLVSKERFVNRIKVEMGLA